jgi:hypothetical protein
MIGLPKFSAARAPVGRLFLFVVFGFRFHFATDILLNIIPSATEVKRTNQSSASTFCGSRSLRVANCMAFTFLLFPINARNEDKPRLRSSVIEI